MGLECIKLAKPIFVYYSNKYKYQLNLNSFIHSNYFLK